MVILDLIKFRANNKALFWINSLLVFWYMANSILGDKTPATTSLLLLSLIMACPVIKNIDLYWGEQKWWFLSLILFGSFNILYLLLEGVDISDDYDKPAKALAAGLIFIYLLRYGFDHRVVGVAIAISTLIGGGYALYEKFVLEFSRAGMITNPIRYGYLVIALSMLCFFYARYSEGKWFKVGFLLVGSLGVLGAYSTGTRGIVVIVLSLAFILIVCNLRSGRLSWKRFGILSGTVLAAVLAISMNTSLFSRYVDKTIYELNKIESGNLNSSIGLRLQMWHVAIYLGSESLLTGGGHDYDVLREKAEKFIDEHNYNPVILVRYGHFHNQFLDAFAKQGLPGLIVWVLFLFGAVYGMKTRYKYAVFIIVITLAAGGLTEAVLRSSRLFYLAILGVSIFRCLDYFEANKCVRALDLKAQSD